MKFVSIFLLALAPAFCAVKVGDPAPAIKLDSLIPDQPVAATLEALKGKVVVLEFWATWCGPCVDAIPHLNELVEKFAGRPIEFLSVTDEEAGVVEAFLKKKPIRGWVGFDRSKAMSKQYGFEAIPDTVLIDASGKLAGVAHPAQLKAEHLEDLLAGKPVKLPPPFGESMAIPRTSLESGPPPLLDIIIRPSVPGSNGGMTSGPGRYQQKSVSARNLLSSVYELPLAFVEGDGADDTARYDVSITGPRTEDKALRKLLPDLVAIALRVNVKRETRDTDGWRLTAPHGTPESLKEAASMGGSSMTGRGELRMTGMNLTNLAKMIQGVLRKPVVDGTGIAGRFDLSLKYDDARPESLLEQLRERGFEFEPAKVPTEYLVVTKK